MNLEDLNGTLRHDDLQIRKQLECWTNGNTLAWLWCVYSLVYNYNQVFRQREFEVLKERAFPLNSWAESLVISFSLTSQFWKMSQLRGSVCHLRWDHVNSTDRTVHSHNNLLDHRWWSLAPSKSWEYVLYCTVLAKAILVEWMRTGIIPSTI
jgi:hypothetical protein